MITLTLSSRSTHLGGRCQTARIKIVSQQAFARRGTQRGFPRSHGPIRAQIQIEHVTLSRLTRRGFGAIRLEALQQYVPSIQYVVLNISAGSDADPSPHC
jgi:hypothetical protein